MDSPCINKCNLDENNICIGCGRSMKEIVNWSSLSDEEREKIINSLE